MRVGPNFILCDWKHPNTGKSSHPAFSKKGPDLANSALNNWNFIFFPLLSFEQLLWVSVDEELYGLQNPAWKSSSTHGSEGDALGMNSRNSVRVSSLLPTDVETRFHCWWERRYQSTCDKKSVHSVEIESILIAPPQIRAMPSEEFVRCDKALCLFLSCSKSFFLFYLGMDKSHP